MNDLARIGAGCAALNLLALGVPALLTMTPPLAWTALGGWVVASLVGGGLALGFVCGRVRLHALGALAMGALMTVPPSIQLMGSAAGLTASIATEAIEAMR